MLIMIVSMEYSLVPLALTIYKRMLKNKHLCSPQNNIYSNNNLCLVVENQLLDICVKNYLDIDLMMSMLNYILIMVSMYRKFHNQNSNSILKGSLYLKIILNYHQVMKNLNLTGPIHQLY